MIVNTIPPGVFQASSVLIPSASRIIYNVWPSHYRHSFNPEPTRRPGAGARRRQQFL